MAEFTRYFKVEKFSMALYLVDFIRRMGYSAHYWPRGGESPSGEYIPITHNISVMGDEDRVNALFKEMEWNE